MVIYSLSLLQIPDFLKDSDKNPTLYRFIYFSNLAAICMILSSFTSRFLFPLISLEGRAFWVLGLAPMSRAKLLTQKVCFGLVISFVLGVMTVTISNIALDSPASMFASAVYTMVLAACCLTCLATGLGAAYPSFHEDNPARIAVGLGGTLNFFVSALSIACLLAIQALPHLILAGGHVSKAGWPWVLVAFHAVSTVFVVLVSGFALHLGRRNLVRSEF
jgi:ABC-2 type transport system permease protein